MNYRQVFVHFGQMILPGNSELHKHNFFPVPFFPVPIILFVFMTPKTILLIEDNADIRENTVELLELEGYQVLQADNGIDGISLAQVRLPDVVICDILMRETDGYTVFRSLLDHKDTCHIPFIFMTAKSETADCKKAYDIGRCSYLVKPFDEKELFSAIRELLENSWKETKE